LPAGFALKPSAIDFGSLSVGAQSDARVISLMNLGDDPIPIHAAMPGQNAGDFRIVAGNCQNLSIPPRGNCSISMIFTPQAAGRRQSQLTITSASQSQSVTMVGGGLVQVQNPSLMVQPSEIDFGSVQVGSQVPGRTVTLINPGMQPVQFHPTLSGRGDFLMTGSNCNNGVVPARSKCGIGVTFTPREAGQSQADLVISSSAPTQSVRLRGTGINKNNPPPAETGWCCVQSPPTIMYRPPSLSQSTRQQCDQRNGLYFTDRRTAESRCKGKATGTPVGQLDWQQRLDQGFDEAAFR
jgi:hypothetical protein